MKGTELEVVVEEPAPGRRDRWIARSRTQAPDVDGVTFVSGKNLTPAGSSKRRSSGRAVTTSSLSAKCKMQSAK